MASIETGIMGPIVGRVGPVSCFIRNGKNIVRTARTNSKDMQTTARLAQREKIAVCNMFTRAFTGTGFFDLAFPSYGQKGTGYNRATAGLMHLAIRGTYPGQYLDWQRVMVAKGPLPPAENLTVTAVDSSTLVFAWTPNGGIGTAKDTDDVVLVAYSESSRAAVFNLNAGQRRDGSATLNTGLLGGNSLATWLFFKNEQGDVSDSVFGGLVTV